jgi:hypothetical protein
MCSLTLAATAVSGLYGAYSQRQQASEQASYERRVSEINARKQENEAQAVKNRSIRAENESRRATAELRARQISQFAALGMDINSGSALNLQNDTLNLGEIDALTIRENYDQQAGQLIEAGGLTRQDGRYRASNIKSQGTANAVGTLLTTAGSVASKWKPKSSLKLNSSLATPTGGGSIHVASNRV